MGWSWRVEAYDAIVSAALETARACGVFLIGRIQDRRDWGLQAQNAELEKVAGGRILGLAAQVFTPAGHCGFACTDVLTTASADQVVRRAAGLARLAARSGGEASLAVFGLQPERSDNWAGRARSLEATPQSVRRAALLEAHREALEAASGFGLRSALGLVDDEWRVVRTDGTDVRFQMPRAVARHRFTARRGGDAASASCSVSGVDDRVLLDPMSRQRLRQRAVEAVRRACDTAGAPAVAAGAYRLVLDHSLAKGLAHEAFGHAVETDGAAGSILATDGRLRLGERLAVPGVSIVDGPIDGDYAYQPISANGVRRQTVDIVKAGLLNSGLGDVFSAERAGSPLTGAGRAENYRARPLPRISNIRLVLEGAGPLEPPPEALTPVEVGECLRAAGLLPGDVPTLYLAGHRGGQVSKAAGDFVFTCSAVYDLSDGAAPRASAILSGKSRSALAAIVGALGGLVLDARGRCVKAGQVVPTSGGSHAFVVLERHPEIQVSGG